MFMFVIKFVIPLVDADVDVGDGVGGRSDVAPATGVTGETDEPPTVGVD